MGKPAARDPLLAEHRGSLELWNNTDFRSVRYASGVGETVVGEIRNRFCSFDIFSDATVQVRGPVNLGI